MTAAPNPREELLRLAMCGDDRTAPGLLDAVEAAARAAEREHILWVLESAEGDACAERVRDALAAAGQAPAPQLDDQPMTRFGPQVQGRCPACGLASLFLGSGGYVGCGNLPCPVPDAATTLLETPAPQPETAPDACPRCGHTAGEHDQPCTITTTWPATVPDAEPGTPDDDREQLREQYAAAIRALNEADGGGNLADLDEDDEVLLLVDTVLRVRDDALTGAQQRITELDRDLDTVMRERDNLHDVADQLAWAIAPMEVIGEHSSENDPWENALDHAAGLHQRAEASEQRITPDALATAIATWPEAGTALHDLGHERVQRELAEHLATALAPRDGQDGGA